MCTDVSVVAQQIVKSKAPSQFDFWNKLCNDLFSFQFFVSASMKI